MEQSQCRHPRTFPLTKEQLIAYTIDQNFDMLVTFDDSKCIFLWQYHIYALFNVRELL